VVLTESEVRKVLAELEGLPWLIAALLYGSGMRIRECLTLRVKDVDLERGEIRLRRGKGGKDRVTVLPAALKTTLTEHLRRVRKRWELDLDAGGGAVALPDSLVTKYPSAAREWPWQ
jgi:integrase